MIRQVAVPLTRLAVGQRGRVAYLRAASHDRLTRLMSLGLSPGTCFELEQVSPAYVIRLGAEETEIALEREVAEDIFVWTSQLEECRPPEGRPDRGGRGRFGFRLGRRGRRKRGGGA